MGLTVKFKKKLGPFQLDVNFESGEGIMGLLGASGCGKSMTLKCIAGIVTPDEGKIVLDGQILFDSAAHINLTPQQRQVGYLFQHYALFPNMTVVQNIASGFRGREKTARDARVAGLLRSFYLEDMAEKYPRQLSGGQQQRTALARILAGDPKILMLDEPFSALDSYLKWQVELETMDILSAFPGPVIFVTHNRNEIRRLCDGVCVLDKGKSQPLQSVGELFHAPSTLSACLLSGCKNISRARVDEGGKIEALDWGVTLTASAPPPTGFTHVGVRAHYLHIVGGPGENTFLCPVERVIEDVFSTVVLLRTPGGEGGFSRLRLELDKPDWAALNAPAALWIYMEPDDLLLLRDQ